MGIPKAPGHFLLSIPAEGPEAARTKEQRQKVGFEVFPLSVPQVNPTSKEERGKPSCPIAGLQHPKSRGISWMWEERPTDPRHFHHHWDGSHRRWVPGTLPHHHSTLHRQFPAPSACSSLCPGSLPVPSSSQQARPGAAAPQGSLLHHPWPHSLPDSITGHHLLPQAAAARAWSQS